MLGENIKILRKQKGYTQETLAQQLNVVRQTVSKWEKGLSVPDAEMLSEISELLEVPVSTLLGSKVSETDDGGDRPDDQAMAEVAKQLALLNEQLANQAARKRKMTRRILIGIPSALIILFIVYMACFIAFRYHVDKNTVYTTTEIECGLDGETYTYSVTYDQDFQIHFAGGDAWVSDHVLTDQYDDANVLLAQIEDYFVERGGTYRIVREYEGTEPPDMAG